VVAVCAIVAVVLVGCGGKSSKDKTAAATSTTSAGDTATTITASGGTATTTKGAATATTAKKTTGDTKAPRPEDAARIDTLVLQASDFPTGWKGTPPTPEDESDQSANAELNQCIGTSGSEAETAHKYGDDFSKDDNAQASSEAATVKDDATYRSDLAAIQGPKLTPCLKEVFTKQMAGPSGAPASEVEVSDLSVPKHGDATVGRRVTISVKGPTASAKFYIDFVFMAKNRVEVVASFLNAQAPFDSALEKSLLDKLGARVSAA
jgi:hypothetical protein